LYNLAIKFATVLLPEPLLPTTKVVWPAGNMKLDGSRTVFSGREGYAKLT